MSDKLIQAAQQALEALELLRTGLIQMREHAEKYGETWAGAYVKEFRDMLPGSAEERFRLLNAMQLRLKGVADGVVKGYDAIGTLRQALEAEQQVEPVAWMDVDDGGVRCGLEFYNAGTGREVPLYTHPQPPRQPLTDEELRDALRSCPHDTVENLRVRWLYAKDFARAIEAAHGIKENT